MNCYSTFILFSSTISIFECRNILTHFLAQTWNFKVTRDLKCNLFIFFCNTAPMLFQPHAASLSSFSTNFCVPEMCLIQSSFDVTTDFFTQNQNWFYVIFEFDNFPVCVRTNSFSSQIYRKEH